MTDDEIIAYGQAAQRLLDSPDFVAAASYISGVHLSALLATADSDKEGREVHFGHIRTIERTLGELRARADEARRLVDALEAAAQARTEPYDPHSTGTELP